MTTGGSSWLAVGRNSIAAASGSRAAPSLIASKVLAAAMRSAYGTFSKASTSAALARRGNDPLITRSNGSAWDMILLPPTSVHQRTAGRRNLAATDQHVAHVARRFEIL